MSLEYTQSTGRRESRSLRVIALIARYGLTWIPFIQVAHFLATLPGADERALLMFFIPPIVAALFVIADNGRFDRTAVRAAWLLLSVTAGASLAAEIDVLPIKP